MYTFFFNDWQDKNTVILNTYNNNINRLWYSNNNTLFMYNQNYILSE